MREGPLLGHARGPGARHGQSPSVRFAAAGARPAAVGIRLGAVVRGRGRRGLGVRARRRRRLRSSRPSPSPRSRCAGSLPERSPSSVARPSAPEPLVSSVSMPAVAGPAGRAAAARVVAARPSRSSPDGPLRRRERSPSSLAAAGGGPRGGRGDGRAVLGLAPRRGRARARPAARTARCYRGVARPGSASPPPGARRPASRRRRRRRVPDARRRASPPARARHGSAGEHGDRPGLRERGGGADPARPPRARRSAPARSPRGPAAATQLTTGSGTTAVAAVRSAVRARWTSWRTAPLGEPELARHLVLAAALDGDRQQRVALALGQGRERGEVERITARRSSSSSAASAIRSESWSSSKS